MNFRFLSCYLSVFLDTLPGVRIIDIYDIALLSGRRSIAVSLSLTLQIVIGIQ